MSVIFQVGLYCFEVGMDFQEQIEVFHISSVELCIIIFIGFNISNISGAFYLTSHALMIMTAPYIACAFCLEFWNRIGMCD